MMSHTDNDTIASPYSTPACLLLPAFYRSDKQLKTVRERYLRVDLNCRSAACNIHGQISSSMASAPKLSAFDTTHYLIPSSHILQRFLDLFTQSTFLTDIILLRSVLSALRTSLTSSSSSLASASSVFKQLNEIINNQNRCIIVYENEFSIDTYRIQKPQETSIQYERRLIITTARYYDKHLHHQIPIIVLDDDDDVATDNSTSQTEKRGDSHQVLTMSAYLSRFHSDHSELMSLYHVVIEAETISSSAPTITIVHPSTRFKPYLSDGVLTAGVKSGFYLSGHLKVRSHHSSIIAYVDLGGRMMHKHTAKLTDVASVTQGYDAAVVGEVLIYGWYDRNRAIDGDEVVIEMLQKNEWKAERTAIDDETTITLADSDTTNSTHSITTTISTANVLPTARIVGIIERHWRPYVATLQPLSSTSASYDHHLVVPMDVRIPLIRIHTRQATSLEQYRLLVQIDDWHADDRYPSGHYVRAIGPLYELETDISCLLIEHRISHPVFSNSMLASLPVRPGFIASHLRDDAEKWAVGSGYHPKGTYTPYKWDIPQHMLTGRLDLRRTHHDCVMAVDPIGCVDIDDALSVHTLPNGQTQVGVHIADVTAFIEYASPLDAEARDRGTSVYLVDRRLDMLPAVLSEDLCSLRGSTERLCVSVLWEFDADGSLVNTSFGRTVIYNAYALSYEEAQEIYDKQGRCATKDIKDSTHSLTQTDYTLLYPKLAYLLHCARRLKQHRDASGAVALSTLDIQFQLNGKKQVTGISPVDSSADDADDSADADSLGMHGMIAEWMIAANAAVAYHIYTHHPQAALLRRHPHPRSTAFRALMECCERLRIPMDVSTNGTLAASLKQAEEMIAEREAASSSASVSTSYDRVVWMMKVLRELAARAMSEATYFSTGSVASPADFYHYGLSVPFYTHFTSPIRRYSDQVVHRLLLSGIERDEGERRKRKADKKKKHESRGDDADAVSDTDMPLFTNESLTQMTDHLNVKNRESRMAGKESQGNPVHSALDPIWTYALHPYIMHDLDADDFCCYLCILCVNACDDYSCVPCFLSVQCWSADG